MSYTNDGNFHRFVARDRANDQVFYHAIQGGTPGDEVNYVRVDETLNVTIHEVIERHDDGAFTYNPTPIEVEVHWS